MKFYGVLMVVFEMFILSIVCVMLHVGFGQEAFAFGVCIIGSVLIALKLIFLYDFYEKGAK